MSPKPEYPELSPEEQILFDIELDETTENQSASVKVDAVEINQSLRVIRSFLSDHGVLPHNDPPSIAPRIRLARKINVEPIATLAAAEVVKATARWEAGDMRFLQSTMRSDLAVEVLVDHEKSEEYQASIYWLRLVRRIKRLLSFQMNQLSSVGNQLKIWQVV